MARTHRQPGTGPRSAAGVGRAALAAVLAMAGASQVTCALAQTSGAPMSFFVTSRGLGEGANLGGLAGADRHCQALAEAAGAGERVWRAYLSTQTREGVPGVSARDRIGPGPWHNAQGVPIAGSLEELHDARSAVRADTALTETGQRVPGRVHDILTGTRLDGTAPSGLDPDMTCGNWTRSGSEGAALVGHHDRVSAIREPWAASWNSAHLTRGCSAAALAELGSGGLFYCFALPREQPQPRP
jgi:hypothetical protein